MYDRKINKGGAYLWRFYVRRNTIFYSNWKYFFSAFEKVSVRETSKNVFIFDFTKVSGCNTFSSYRLSTSNLYFL